MTGDTVIDLLQADVAAILRAAPELADANVIVSDSGDVEAEIKRKLGTHTHGSTGKPGLVIVVLQPVIGRAARNLPGPEVEVAIQLQVIEQPRINRKESGTGVTCGTAALRALATLHLQVLGNTILTADEEAITPVANMQTGYLSYLVNLTLARHFIGPAAKTAAVHPEWSVDDTLILSTATADAEIYYTTDGSYPAPSNPAALLYLEAVADLAAGTTVRAAAYAPALNPSDCLQLTITT